MCNFNFIAVKNYDWTDLFVISILGNEHEISKKIRNNLFSMVTAALNDLFWPT